MLNALAANLVISTESSPLIAGTGKDDSVLIIVITSDRGLCGAFNGSIVRETRRLVRQLESTGKKVSVLCIGRKGRDLLRREFAEKIVFTTELVTKKGVSFASAENVAREVIELFAAGGFDVARVVYNRFRSVISQVVTVKQIVPVEVVKTEETRREQDVVVSEFEPDVDTILAELLPRNLAMQIYAAMLESGAGEQAARMTAMDNATRNAGDMINKLTLNYNRSRQAFITKEMIEIISGAEAAV